MYATNIPVKVRVSRCRSRRPTSWAGLPGWPGGAVGFPDAGAARARKDL